MRKLLFFWLWLVVLQNAKCQDQEVSKKIFEGFTLAGGMDVYYAYDLNNNGSKNIPYYVSMANNNTFSINLAYIDLKYESSRIRGRLIPAIGSFMDANYSAESGLNKLPVEFNIGVKPLKKKNIWLDIGVLSSPYTNESALSKDHLMYSRSLAPEYVPYYLAGAKLSYALSDKWKVVGYFLNGWQQIADQNKAKSVGTQVEFKPSSKETFNWNTYFGDERSASRPLFRMRYFTDVYWLHDFDGRFSLATCAYAGIQQMAVSTDVFENLFWWQMNVAGRYTFRNKLSVTARMEYFSDPDMVQVIPITGGYGFECFGSSLGINLPIENNALFRLEAKNLLSTGQKVFYDKEFNQINSTTILMANITMWF
ncbi:MAG: outer membrane beta-barrel protein [Flavobacteriia bacterium]